MKTKHAVFIQWKRNEVTIIFPAHRGRAAMDVAMDVDSANVLVDALRRAVVKARGLESGQ